ncbi:RAD55 family ATPase [Candidatus Nitrosotalea okcheonensis]|uniref:Putative gas vesicle protein GvpD n=1 Tax=Candidatus Nitrosotalea okcheonensis TaxID=1903276 RepID=A0A2H1FFA9_9ARCH|nr:ATPase domain-containing protein [Candidatus Nitrosotalea okcheonensis]SMH71446.1 putative gas vesicle protein GvpD [Candidatus Nitrosotalea okcheonensis]
MTEVGSYQLTGDKVKIPLELAHFLRQETYSLLIKGHTGTGKTTLALSILRKLNIDRNCLYISTRVSPDQLFQYHTWMDGFFNQPKKIDAPLDAPEEEENIHPTFVDARLDEPVTLFERITNELMDVRAPIIIIDSWDSIGCFMDKEASMSNSKVLQTWRERAGAKLIFVTENPEDRALDFLVDGIVELRQKYHNERIIREIRLSKLRGVRINKPSYIFSVNNGMFHSYDHYHPSEFLNPARFLQPKDNVRRDLIKTKSHFTTGYPELDEMLGDGFPTGCAVSVELGPHVSANVALAFLCKIITNFIASENLFLFQPLEKTGQGVILQYAKSLGLQSDLIKIISSTTQPKQSTATLRDNPNKHLDHIRQEIQKIKKKHPKKMLLTILGTEVTDLFSKDPSKQDRKSLSFIKSNSDLSIFVSRRLPDNRHTIMSDIVDVRLLIVEIDGTLCLQSETPWSHLYAITTSPENDNEINLGPIV